MTGWGRFIIRRLSPEKGHTSVCCSRRVYDYMWCASQWRNEVLYLLHVFITRCRTIWMRIPIDQSNDLICTMECDKRFEYFSLATVNWCSTFMLEGFSMYLPHMTHTHFRAFVPADLLVGYACMARPFQAAYDSGRCAAPCCITAVIDPAHPQMQAAVAKDTPETKQLLLQGSYFPQISHKAHNHGTVENYPKWKETNIGDTPHFALGSWLWEGFYQFSGDLGPVPFVPGGVHLLQENEGLFGSAICALITKLRSWHYGGRSGESHGYILCNWEFRQCHVEVEGSLEFLNPNNFPLYLFESFLGRLMITKYFCQKPWIRI